MQRSLHILWPSERSVQECLDLIDDAAAVLIRIAQTRGSTPRESGCWMLVTRDLVLNTIGGGHLEFEAIAMARELLGGSGPSCLEKEFKLGPSLGQCCGGALRLEFYRLQEKDGRAAMISRLIPDPQVLLTPVAIVGGGHVGHAIVQALLPLPFRLTWIDSREGVFPEFTHPRLTIEPAEDVAAIAAGLDPQSMLLIMSFTHAEDLEVVRTALVRRRRDPTCFPFIGLIGSKTKWARFRQRLMQRGFSPQELDSVTCPIGLAGIRGKAPAVIAASVASQLLVLQVARMNVA